MGRKERMGKREEEREWEKRAEGRRVEEEGKNQGPWNYMPQGGMTFSNDQSKQPKPGTSAWFPNRSEM